MRLRFFGRGRSGLVGHAVAAARARDAGAIGDHAFAGWNHNPLASPEDVLAGAIRHVRDPGLFQCFDTGLRQVEMREVLGDHRVGRHRLLKFVNGLDTAGDDGMRENWPGGPIVRSL
jgi:hypothetical protein